MIYAELVGDTILDRGVFFSLDEFLPYREKGWVSTPQTNAAADQRLLAQAKLQYFADYDDPNADPQELQQRCRELKINGKDWEGYYARRAEKATQF